MSSINPMRRRLLDYLEGFGLAGGNIQADGWDDVGFIARNPITGEDAGFAPWPEGFDFKWFCILALVADREDYRLAGIQSV